MTVISMQVMRYINLLDKFSNVKTSKCFMHNNTLFFAVDKRDVSRAIGPGASNIRRMNDSIGLKIKIIPQPDGISDAKRFIEDIIDPIKIKSVDMQNNELVINVGNTQAKATLFGRNKKRFEELKQIVEDNFNVGLRII